MSNNVKNAKINALNLSVLDVEKNSKKSIILLEVYNNIDIIFKVLKIKNFNFYF